MPKICFSYVSDFRSTKIIRKSIEEICDILKIDFKCKNRLVLIVDASVKTASCDPPSNSNVFSDEK